MIVHTIKGSDWYAEHTIQFPIAKTVACINMDLLNIFGRTRDVTFFGSGKSELDDYAAWAAEKQGRTVGEGACRVPRSPSPLFMIHAKALTASGPPSSLHAHARTDPWPENGMYYRYAIVSLLCTVSVLLSLTAARVVVVVFFFFFCYCW
jgi:hypothetical protein